MKTYIRILCLMFILVTSVVEVIAQDTKTINGTLIGKQLKGVACQSDIAKGVTLPNQETAIKSKLSQKLL